MVEVSSSTRIGAMLTDWVIPATCCACEGVLSAIDRELDSGFCHACASTLEPLGPHCLRCADPVESVAVVCLRCQSGAGHLQRLVVPWQYGGQLAVAITKLKFARQTHIAARLHRLWEPALAAAIAELDADVVVPIPLHWRRRWSRGFDQTALLLAATRTSLSAPVWLGLRRIRSTKAQTTLSAEARRSNVVAAFVAAEHGSSWLKGKRVVLVDDVVTTAATMHAAALACHRAGAAAVWGVAVAKTVL